MKNSFLHNFKILNPEFRIPQNLGREWIKLAYHESLSRQNKLQDVAFEEWINKYTVSENQIAERYTELKDFSKTHLKDNIIFNQVDGAELGSSLDQRMKFYDEKVNFRAQEIFNDIHEAPSHLLHVTCTGYLSPSPLQRLCSEKKWHRTEITQIYHMGCYAAMPAIRVAQALNQTQDVTLFHSELCTLHFTTKNFTPEQLIVQSLFADGYIRYSSSENKPTASPSLEILALGEMRVPESEEDMTWSPGSTNFNMSISRDVPLKLAVNIYEGLQILFDKANLNLEEIIKTCVFAIHPGGPKILEQVSTLLELKPSQISESTKILKTKGNMSSATLPHIWSEILENKTHQEGQIVVSLAFGPGLTLFGGIFKIHA